MERSGFTLIELMLVVTIMAILAGTGGYLSIASRDKTALTASADLLKSHLEEARMNALYGKKPKDCPGNFTFAGIEFSYTANGYTLTSVCKKTSGAGFALPVTEDLFSIVFDNPRIHLNLSNTIVFTPLLESGITDSLGNSLPEITLILTLDGTSNTKEVHITPQGYIQ